MGETMKRNKILNLAYGSNLNLGQMAYRCPTAKVYGKGMLLDYQLLFKGREDNAYATIEPKRGSKVPVLVWELQPEDEKALDYYAGENSCSLHRGSFIDHFPRYTLAHIKDRCPADTIMRFISGFKEPFKKVCHISHHPFSLAAVPFTK
jgi:hypothetical protein